MKQQPRGKAFEKGVSGNPGGRPRIPESVREAARALSPAALKALGEIVSDPAQTGGARVSAATVILDRAWGKAEQTLNVNTKRPADMSRDELDASIAALLAKHVPARDESSDGQTVN